MSRKHDCRVCMELADLRARSMAASDKALLERLILSGHAGRNRLVELDEELRQTIAAQRYAEAAIKTHTARVHTRQS